MHLSRPARLESNACLDSIRLCGRRRPIVTEMETNGRKHAARLSMAKDQGLLAVNPHIPAIVEVLSNAEIFFPGSQGAAIGELLTVRVGQAIAGELKPKEALDAAVNDINAYLASHPGE